VRGYLADVLERRRGELGDGVRFVENAGYRDNNILQSLFHAEAELGQPFIFTYADIVFAPHVVTRLMQAAGDICLVVDRRFADVYVGRTEHPLSEAEVCSVGDDGFVAKVGKRALPPEQAAGELSGSQALGLGRAGVHRRIPGARGALRRPRRRALPARAHLAERLPDRPPPAPHRRGVRMTPVFIDGDWREIDTVQDLERAERDVDF